MEHFSIKKTFHFVECVRACAHLEIYWPC